MKYDNALLSQLAADFGTPLYVYNEAVMERQYRALEGALEGLDASICFAVKANSNLAVIKSFATWGAGFDVVSQGEIRKVIHAGGDAHKIVFSGVGKLAEEVEIALSKGIRMINVESMAELKVIEEVARSMRRVAPIAFRVNPDISVETHPYLTTGIKTSKFGIPEEDISAAWEAIRQSPSIQLVGVDCHIGSQITDVRPLHDAYAKILSLASALREQGAEITTLDFGGGLGVPFSGHYSPLDMDAYAGMVRALLGNAGYKIIVEPGKFLMAEAGQLLTEVLYMKHNGENQFVVVDAGMNDLIRPSLYDAFHQIDLLAEDAASRPTVEVDIVGPVCETGCYFARKRELPTPKPGEHLLIRDAGAYGMSMASSYNARRLPAEVMVGRDGACRLVRKRDSFEDLWRNEVEV